MKLEQKMFKYMLITIVFIILIVIGISFYFRVIQIIKCESDRLLLLNKNFENKLNNTITKVENLIEEISSTNDVIFIFDKNSLISNFSMEALKKEFVNILDKNNYIDGIYIIDENNKLLSIGEEYTFQIKEGMDSQIFDNDFYIIFNKRINSKKNRYLIFLVNISRIFEEYKQSLNLGSSYFLLIKSNDGLILINKEGIIQKIDQAHLKKMFLTNNKVIFRDIEIQLLETYDDLFQSIRRAILVFIGTVGIAVVVSWVISKYLSSYMVNSINKITKIIENSKPGKYNKIEIDDSYEEELKRLSLKFNEMINELNMYINNMEEMVEERTKRINEQNKMLKRLNEKLKETSIKDDLTKLYNRRYFNERFIEDFKFAYREKLYINFAIIDIDHFKNINDKYGHLAGDYCLKELSKIFKTYFHRSTDKIYRYGGEEFAIYYISKDNQKFKELLETLKNDVENREFIYENKKIKFTISIGAISSIPENTDYIKFIKIADDNLYKVKRSGRNKIYITEN
ncbi:hypothetical protein JCM30566_10880 [Marinitoga arctica]